MSLIETAPRDRLAIQTVVTGFDEDVVKRAIENELARDGQVYFIHNRVESIDSLAALVVKLVPKARVVVGHGQMGEKDLENVMLKFIRGESNVLVATTIVENGLDIPARQHHFDQSRRSTRPRGTLSAPRPSGPLASTRLCLPTGSTGNDPLRNRHANASRP